MIWQFAGKVCNEYFFVSIYNGLKLLMLKSKENLYGVSHRKERAGLQTCRLKHFFPYFLSLQVMELLEFLAAPLTSKRHLVRDGDVCTH